MLSFPQLKVWSANQSKILEAITSEVCLWLLQFIDLWMQVRFLAVLKCISMASERVKLFVENQTPISFCVLDPISMHETTISFPAAGTSLIQCLSWILLFSDIYSFVSLGTLPNL